VTQPKVIVLVGLPGAGKSTWARAQGAAVLSSDEMRLLLAGDEKDQTIHARVFAAMRYLLRQRLELGAGPTILDATNLRRRDRKPWLKLAAAFSAAAEAVYFDVPLAVCLERNAARVRVVPPEVIRAMHADLEPPTRAEGFRRIISISA
jgi:predicted kinase